MIILAVDDEALGLQSLTKAIAKADPEAEIKSFSSSKEALEFASENDIDVAFLDIQMPEITGTELAKKLKMLKPSVNIIFATGFDSYMGDAFALHANGYVLKPITAAKVKKELDNHRIVLVAGFQGINKYDDITTLGRGGSDTSAVAIAASMGADLCQIYTDVEGVFTADPRKVDGARKLNEITYDEMLELATLGAQVLNNRSVEMAKKYNVELEVLSSFSRKPGTIVKEATKMEKMLVKGVACDKHVARVSIVGVPDEPGVAFKLFSLVAKAHINVDIILQSVGRDGTKDITFTVPDSDGEAACEAVRPYCENVGAQSVTFDDSVAKLSIVGAGMETHDGVASKMFEALFDAGVNISMISTSEIKISVLIDEKDCDRAVSAVHAKFFDN